MNVFDAIYFNESDPVKRAFIAAETALDIAVSQALKDFEYESGLMDLSDNSVFTEAGDANNGAKENIFVKAIKGIFNAISSFISSVIDTISGIFDKRDPITEDDVKSGKGKEHLDKLDKAANSEINKGKDLLKKASSGNGVSDNEINTWISEGIKTVKAVVPPETGAAIAVLSVNKLMSFLKSKKDAAKDCEKMALTGSGTLTSSQQKQKTKIAAGFQKILNAAISPITKSVEKSHKLADKQYVKDRHNQRASYEELEAEFTSGQVTIEKYFEKLQALSTIDKEIEREYGAREAQRRAAIERRKAINSMCKEGVKKIKSDHNAGKFTARNANLRIEGIGKIRADFIKSDANEQAYSTAYRALQNQIFSR